MQQVFVNSQAVSKDCIRIEGDDVNHIVNVLRMKIGEKIRVSDDSNRSYFCHISSLDRDCVIVDIDSVDEVGTELENDIYLFQGLPKSDKMELIIQKSVELGVKKITPVAMKNCVVKLDNKKAISKNKRWQAIAESAAKQSKRTIIPEVAMPMSYKEAMESAKNLDIILVPYENERGMEATREVLNGIERGKSIGIFVGPEGGFAEDEVNNLPDNAHRISLGRRILRTETAGLATLSMLVFCLDQ